MILPIAAIAALALTAMDPVTGREAFTRGILDALLERDSGSVWDLPANLNPRKPGAPVLIRLAEWNRAIDLGDAAQLAAFPGPIHLIVGFYRPKPEDSHQANLLAMHEVLVTPEIWRKLWGSVQPAEVADLARQVSTGDRVGAHNFALAEIGRLQLRGMRLTLEPRIGETERSVTCLLPFDIFYADVLGLQRAEIQTTPTLWGQPVAREFDLGAPRAVAVRPPTKPSRPLKAGTEASLEPAQSDVALLPTVRVDPTTGQPSVQLPSQAEQIVEALKRTSSEPSASPTPTGPTPPPPVDTGWTRIELDKPIQLGP